MATAKEQFDRLHQNAQFLRAAKQGNFAQIKKLHAQGVSVNAIGTGGATALCLATKNGFADIVDFLLEKNANADHQDDSGNTALHYAAKEEREGIFFAVLEKTSKPDIKNANNETPALLALFCDTPDMLVAAIKSGACVDQTDTYGNALVLIAQVTGRHNMVDALLSLEASLYSKTARHNKTLLNLAQTANQKNVVDAILLLYKEKNPFKKGTAQPLKKRRTISF